MRKKISLILVCLLLIFLSQNVRAINFQALKPDGLNYDIQYTHYSNNKLVVNGYSFYDFLILGTIDVEKVENEVVITSLTARYQLTPDLNLDFKLPFRYRRRELVSYSDNQGEDFNEKVLDELGLGDVEITLGHQRELKEDLYQLESLSLKTTTGSTPYENELALGSGHLGLKFGLTRVKRLDPIMIFGGSSYCINFARDDVRYEGAYSEINPGNTFQYSLGLAYALNSRVTLNTRFEHSLTGSTEIDGETRPDSDSTNANLYLGLNYLKENGINYDLTLGIGLTEDSPDFSITFSRPIF